MTKRISLGLVVSVALLTALVAGVVFAGNSWSKYHWDISTAESNADPLNFGDNLTTAAWTSSLAAASTDWNASVIKNEIIAGSGTDCGPVHGGVEVCNREYGENGWLGIAQIWVYRGKDGHIAKGLVNVNDTYFNMEKYDSQAWRDFVVCQEVGHTLGLGHQDENFDNPNLGTCMDYTNDPDGTIYGQASNLDPNQHDLDVLTEKYGHLNGIKAPGKGKVRKPKKSEPPGQDVKDWGKAIKKDGKGRPDLFERDLGNGDKLFTHVIWAN